MTTITERADKLNTLLKMFGITGNVRAVDDVERPRMPFFSHETEHQAIGLLCRDMDAAETKVHEVIAEKVHGTPVVLTRDNPTYLIHYEVAIGQLTT